MNTQLVLPDYLTFVQLSEEADQQLFNKLYNNTDHCLCSLLPALSTASQLTNCTREHTTQQRHTSKNWAPHKFNFSHTPYTWSHVLN